MGMEFRPYYLAREWVNAGHDVTIVSGTFSHVRQNNPSIKGVEMIDGIRYHWLKLPSYQGNGARRVANIVAYSSAIWLKANHLAARYEPELVISSSTHPLDYYGAHRVAKRTGAIHVHEVHDLWPLTLYEIGGMSRQHPWIRLLQVAEDAAYTNSDFVVSMLPDTMAYMANHGLDESRFVYIPNGVVREDWADPEPLAPEIIEIMEAVRHRARMIVGYAGGFNPANELESLLDAAAAAPNGIEIVLAGSGPARASLEKSFDRGGNVTFLPAIPKRQIPSLLALFDVCFVGHKRSPLYRFGVSPNKVFDYMMASKPIIYSVEASNDPVSDANCGISIRSEDVGEITRAIREFDELGAARRLELGQNGRNYVLSHHTFEELAPRFLAETSPWQSEPEEPFPDGFASR